MLVPFVARSLPTAAEAARNVDLIGTPNLANSLSTVNKPFAAAPREKNHIVETISAVGNFFL
jgi:hypothetical protein